MSSSDDSLQKKYPWLFLDKKIAIDIIYDLPDEGELDNREISAVEDTVKTAKEIFKALESLGHEVQLVPIRQSDYEEKISNLRGEVVFNQVEDSELGEMALKYLEKINKRVTGVDSKGFALSWEKGDIKEMLIKSGVPTPRYFSVDVDEQIDENGLSYPLFVKAADDHGSLSITDNSMVKNREELVSQVGWIRETIGGEALVEEYIDGRELGVTVLGNGEEQIILPIKEIVFGEVFLGKPQIVTFKAKWEEGSEEFLGTSTFRCPAELTDVEEKAIELAVKKACEALGVRDYARFDIRLKDSVPYIIDYNANPALGPADASGLPIKVFGLSYPQFIGAIVAVALRRKG